MLAGCTTEGTVSGIDIMTGYGELSKAIEASVRRSVEDKDCGISFSGGLDSGLVAAIAAKYARSVTLYTCGTSNAFDVLAAKDAAVRLGLPWVHVRISKGNVERILREMIAGTMTTDPFTLSYELQLFCVCKEAREDTILSGQGSDEYFMGCAKYVDRSDDDYDMLVKAGVDRLLSVSIPCEDRIAEHFGKRIFYPYMDKYVLEEIAKLDPEDLRPKDMDSRKQVLKDIAREMGYGFLAERKKKSSQYGSGTTDIVRALARERGMMYNQYIAHLSDSILTGTPELRKGSFVNARVDPIIKVTAENILCHQGITPSEAVERLYRRIIERGELDL